MDLSEEIQDLVYRYLQGEATAEECSRLQAIFVDGKEARQAFEQMARTWQYGKYAGTWQAIDIEKAWANIVQGHRKRRRLPLRKVGWAASLLLAIGATLFFLLGREDAATPQLTENKPAARGVQLILSNGERITLDGNGGGDFSEQGAVIQNDSALLTYSRTDAKGDTIPVYNELRVPRGSEYRLKLADNTLVVLNADSRLVYPVAFTGERRQVFLEGEGYFEVARDSARPFVVETSTLDVNVLGTGFNISAYQEERQSKVTLVHGKVSVRSEAGTSELLPRQQYAYDKEKHESSVQEVNIEPYTAWISGTLVFDGTPLEEVAQKLARWYDAEFVFMSEELKGIRFSGRFKKYEELPYILSLIRETTEVQLNLKDNTVVIY